MTDVLDVKFDHPNVGYVLDGLETATVRYEFEHNVQPGHVLRLLTPGGEQFAQAVVTNVTHVPVRHAYISLRSMDATHPSGDAPDLLNRLNGHYDAEIRMDSPVQVIQFELLDGDGDG